MSARVFIPLPFENMTIRSPNASDRRTIRRGTDKVRRVLFGPVDHVETKKFFEKEFALQKTNDKEKWGFDFEREIPLNTSERYIWKPVQLMSHTIDMSPVKRKRSSMDVEDNGDCYAPSLSDIIPITTPPVCQNVITNKNKKQCLITGKKDRGNINVDIRILIFRTSIDKIDRYSFNNANKIK